MDPPKELLEKARRLAAKGDTGPEAVRVNTAILEMDPTWVGAYVARGVCYLERGDLAAAEEDFRRSLRWYPNNPTVLDRLREIEDLRKGKGAPEKSSAARVAGPGDRRHSVYVVELNKGVLKEPRFLAANPKRDPKKPCVYVGMTWHSPEKRFENHKKGHKASRYVKRYGERLLPHLYERFNPMSREEAARKEVELARELRELGYTVWSN